LQLIILFILDRWHRVSVQHRYIFKQNPLTGASQTCVCKNVCFFGGKFNRRFSPWLNALAVQFLYASITVIMHYVIGSGPAGTACAWALLARGAEVTMLDVGLELEPDKAQTIRQIGSKPPETWTPQDRTAIRGPMEAGAKGIPLKLLFGSDFPYRETTGLIPWQADGLGLQPTLALGGFSNVWGSAMLPHRDKDITDWPVTNADLAPHYQAVTEFTSLAVGNDDLKEWFPTHCRNPQSLQLSRQASRLLKNLESQRDSLRKRGWRFGRARVAVRANDGPRGRGCVYCRECMSGCPYGCIYNSADTVREMQANPRFTYQRDVVVAGLKEEKDQIVISGFDHKTRKPLSFSARRAYLGAGVIPTAQILLRSQGAFDQTILLRDSQYFLFPLLLARRARDVQREQLYTLSQLFIELDQPHLSQYTVHLQVYTHSDIIGLAVRKTLGPLQFLAPQLEERMVIVQGYIHSRESSSIAMTLRRNNGGDFLQLEPRLSPTTCQTVKKVVSELLKNAHRLGGLVIPPMLQIAEPGRGFHNGGSLPMRHQPGELETDVFGRPQGWSRLHIVDASVLPSIPATTITFSVMANAHRIGWQTPITDNL
jgi:choline dehydrogenase-like flavoprotein